MTKLDLIAQIADLKENQYKTTLLLSALIEILTENNLLTQEHLSEKAFLLDYNAELDIARMIAQKNTEQH